MTSEEKIKWVRDRVYELENLGGSRMMVYPLQSVVQEIGGDLHDFFGIFLGGNPSATTPPRPKERVVVITVDEQKEILKRLEAQQLLKILEVRGDDVLLEVFPKQPSPLKLKTIEYIARKLADKFTGTEIVDILLDYGIPRSDIPYPNTKWRTLQELFLTLATSPSLEQREKFSGAIMTFLHPLNFSADENMSHELIDDFNKYLKYDGYEITATEDGEGYVLTQTKDKTKVGAPVKQKTEVRKQAEQVEEMTSPRLSAERQQTGSQKILDALEDAMVRGLERMSFEPQSHNHQTVQKIEIIAMPKVQLHKESEKSDGFYITKKGDDFLYKGRHLNLSKKTDYYQVFSSLYAKLPEGGEVSYQDLASEIESRLPKTKGKRTDDVRKFIQRNLTDKSNGFMRYAAIPETEDNGKPLIEVARGSGVVFNNKAG